eukprot:9539522-Karenia_brevis.AAC.1
MEKSGSASGPTRISSNRQHCAHCSSKSITAFICGRKSSKTQVNKGRPTQHKTKETVATMCKS